MNETNRKIREVTTIAVGVATIIGGGIAIFVVSSIFPMPGVKYLIMSPYLSMVIYVIQSKVKSNFIILKLGAVLAMIMTLINLFMGIAILLTTLLTHLSVIGIKNYEQRIFWGSVFFSGYTGVCALVVTRLFIGGIADSMSIWWLMLIGLTSAGFGVGAIKLSRIILKHMTVYPLVDEQKRI